MTLAACNFGKSGTLLSGCGQIQALKYQAGSSLSRLLVGESARKQAASGFRAELSEHNYLIAAGFKRASRNVMETTTNINKSIKHNCFRISTSQNDDCLNKFHRLLA